MLCRSPFTEEDNHTALVSLLKRHGVTPPKITVKKSQERPARPARPARPQTAEGGAGGGSDTGAPYPAARGVALRLHVLKLVAMHAAAHAARHGTLPPLGALLDPNRDVKKFGKLVPTSHPDVVGVEVRDPKRPEFGVITLIFNRDAASPGGLKLTHWVALDSQNHRTTVRLRNHRYGVSVADSAFRFSDPRKSSRRPG